MVELENLNPGMFVLLLQSSLVSPISNPCLVLALDPVGVLLARASQVLLE